MREPREAGGIPCSGAISTAGARANSSGADSSDLPKYDVSIHEYRSRWTPTPRLDLSRGSVADREVSQSSKATELELPRRCAPRWPRLRR